MLVLSGRLLRLAALGGAALEAGTVAGLAVTTLHGLFGFTETSAVEYYWLSVWVEITGAVVLLVLAVLGDTRGLIPFRWRGSGGGSADVSDAHAASAGHGRRAVLTRR